MLTVTVLQTFIGYTGQISQEEYDALSDADQERYNKTDTCR